MSKPTQPATPTSLSADIQAAGHLQAQVDAQVQASVDTPIPAAEHTHEVKPLNPLTHKQKKFVELIVDDNLSKTEAYIRSMPIRAIQQVLVMLIQPYRLLTLYSTECMARLPKG
jgi:hypothetical protein